jgi:hypothetical protein
VDEGHDREAGEAQAFDVHAVPQVDRGDGDRTPAITASAPASAQARGSHSRSSANAAHAAR